VVVARAIWGFGTTGLVVKFGDSTAAVTAGYDDTSATVTAPVHGKGAVNVLFINADDDSTYFQWKYGAGKNIFGFDEGGNRF
jgi:hypothetical protein